MCLYLNRMQNGCTWRIWTIGIYKLRNFLTCARRTWILVFNKSQILHRMWQHLSISCRSSAFCSMLERNFKKYAKRFVFFFQNKNEDFLMTNQHLQHIWYLLTTTWKPCPFLLWCLKDALMQCSCFLVVFFVKVNGKCFIMFKIQYFHCVPNVQSAGLLKFLPAFAL